MRNVWYASTADCIKCYSCNTSMWLVNRTPRVFQCCIQGLMARGQGQGLEAQRQGQGKGPEVQ